ncbi:hypothetical protein BD410DRAFT_788922 [Rickenella mellea]|uniref:FAD-binding FR-type domain-containing protein n=1 Tax=Rickenella mellea TaxID=50990 RepID=A0A4Y7Q5K9_9AGAM|nr:hypothetical protein BD410DRAFT_788922 [Rickenella mellea]
MPTDLKGWHRGERTIQEKLNYAGVMATAYTWIENGLPDEHRMFHTTRLPFVPVTTLDADGRPWSSLVAGESGKPGFITSPNDTELDMNLKVWQDDPIVKNLESFGKIPKTLIAGLGIEFSTRRRNKFAGWVTRKDNSQVGHMRLRVNVNQAIGNCPKYINVRDLVGQPQTSPEVAYRKLKLTESDRLPEELISFIHTSDTTFIGTSYEAPSEDANRYPSHVGMNSRGGRQGFIRVKPSDGRTVVLPDFSGNRLLTSLGNIEVTPLASLSFTCFTTGDILYLTGRAATLIQAEAQKVMPRQNVLTTVYVTGYIFIRNALPVRQRPGTKVQQSPYSPPVKYLAEEKSRSDTTLEAFVTLKRVEIHSPSLATFTWETSEPVHIIPGQAAVLDFSELLGIAEYQHMAMRGDEVSLNDDRVRTWTVSSAHLDPEGTRSFSLTMRKKPGGVVTGSLFSIATKLAANRPELLSDATPLGLKVSLTGISGEFTMPPTATKLLWIAGGIGVTPFLSMIRFLSVAERAEDYDVALVISSREPNVMLSLLNAALHPLPARFKLVVDLFTRPGSISQSLPQEVTVRVHDGRVSPTFLGQSGLAAKTRVVFLCGPPLFEETVVEALRDSGVDIGEIKREGFAY